MCSAFSAPAGIQGHIKMHHAHTNVVGLGDSSVWKVPFLSRTVYLFFAPLAVPIITPLVALCKSALARVEPPLALRRHSVLTPVLDVCFSQLISGATRRFTCSGPSSWWRWACTRSTGC